MNTLKTVTEKCVKLEETISQLQLNETKSESAMRAEFATVTKSIETKDKHIDDLTKQIETLQMVSLYSPDMLTFVSYGFKIKSLSNLIFETKSNEIMFDRDFI